MYKECTCQIQCALPKCDNLGTTFSENFISGGHIGHICIEGANSARQPLYVCTLYVCVCACKLIYLVAEIVSGNLKQILNLFYALSRFKHRTNPEAGSRIPVTSSINGNHVMTSSQAAFGGSRDEQLASHNQWNRARAT